MLPIWDLTLRNCLPKWVLLYKCTFTVRHIYLEPKITVIHLQNKLLMNYANTTSVPHIWISVGKWTVANIKYPFSFVNTLKQTVWCIWWDFIAWLRVIKKGVGRLYFKLSLIIRDYTTVLCPRCWEKNQCIKHI